MATATKAQVDTMGVVDTLVNTDAVTFSKHLKNGVQGAATIQVVVNRLTGTAAGTAIVYGAISGSRLVDTAAYVATGDTFVFTNVASQSKVFDFPTGKYTHYRVVVTSSGTVAEIGRAHV